MGVELLTVTQDDMHAELMAHGKQIAALDREVAVIRTEMSGMHKEVVEIKADVRAAANYSVETRDRVAGIENQARGAWRIMIALQVVLAVAVALVGLMGVR